mmetsp:Transcript_4505/g.13643  ORF Transcript_4505/g.13643 Transcript_4505/m.13643 type:complete len:298 (-) Transcript_4505:895-1788(-)
MRRDLEGVWSDDEALQHPQGLVVPPEAAEQQDELDVVALHLQHLLCLRRVNVVIRPQKRQEGVPGLQHEVAVENGGVHELDEVHAAPALLHSVLDQSVAVLQRAKGVSPVMLHPVPAAAILTDLLDSSPLLLEIGEQGPEGRGVRGLRAFRKPAVLQHGELGQRCDGGPCGLRQHRREEPQDVPWGLAAERELPDGLAPHLPGEEGPPVPLVQAGLCQPPHVVLIRNGVAKPESLLELSRLAELGDLLQQRYRRQHVDRGLGTQQQAPPAAWHIGGAEGDALEWDGLHHSVGAFPVK